MNRLTARYTKTDMIHRGMIEKDIINRALIEPELIKTQADNMISVEQVEMVTAGGQEYVGMLEEAVELA